ncbi:hypothetical protein Btus_2327 [Kyrpidia tusciae DSM 2912]|uniref:Uncharacterized protein n=1 Tax=Kyrpidia tusciae (strain DSM 2912 / NBRC 15312 / T2) TaxID=562970 RepID=D5WS44_KYRT2|nr:hypothetical protein Btus_2327 [Kyrpidia tusciae DSM 2912]
MEPRAYRVAMALLTLISVLVGTVSLAVRREKFSRFPSVVNAEAGGCAGCPVPPQKTRNVNSTVPPN